MGGILAAVLLAWSSPSLGVTGGPVRPEITIKLIGVATIFFCSGLKLRLSEAVAAVKNWRSNLTIQVFHFCAAPLLFVALHRVVVTIAAAASGGALDATAVSLLAGIKLLGCLPPPISSAVLLTEVASGNTAISILNSAGGSFLGLGLTPLLLTWATGNAAEASPSKMVLELGLIVVLPLALGQAAARFGLAPLPSAIGKAMLILIIWHVFCETFSKPVAVDVALLALLAATITLAQLAIIAAAAAFSHVALRQQRRDTVATLYTCYHKSLTLGMPILLAMYGDALTVEVVALLIYHPVQIGVGSLIVPWLQTWVAGEAAAAQAQSNAAVLDAAELRPMPQAASPRPAEP
jgi:sodium/bile acid cotransporter 7